MGFKSMVYGALTRLAHGHTAHNARLDAIEDRLDELELARDVDKLPDLPPPLWRVHWGPPVVLPRSGARSNDVDLEAVRRRCEEPSPIVLPSARAIAATVLAERWRVHGEIDAREAYREYVGRGGRKAEHKSPDDWHWGMKGLRELGYKRAAGNFMWRPCKAA